TLAGIRFPPSTFPELARSNRARFLRFLAEHATWEEASLVSVPFLSSQLEAKGLDRSALAMHVAEKLSAYSTEMPIALRAVRLDEAPGTLEQLAKSEAERVAIEHCSHPSILYRYRNHIVHESRIPGYAMEIYDEPTAHYCSYINDPHWRLAYPFLMFERIAK